MKIKKIKPMFTTVITTMNKYEKKQIITPVLDVTKLPGTVKEYQTVLAVGSTVRGVKVGDIVLINPIRYAVKKHQAGTLKDGVITDNPTVAYNIPTIELDGIECLKIQDADIEAIIEEYEE